MATSNKNFYEIPNLIWLLLFSLIVFVSLLAYLPEVIPFDKLGQFGVFTKYMHTEHRLLTILIFWAMWATHLCEAVYVVKVGHSLEINAKYLNLWFFQTLLLGYPSTRLMLNHAKKQHNKRS